MPSAPWLRLMPLALAMAVQAGPPALAPPSSKVLKEARAIVGRMRSNPRGPYRRLRWWCNDGSVLPPDPYACVEHGGGHQHGQYSPDRERLASLGWRVGTILTPLPFEELWDGDNRNQRMRELVVERYLTETGDGWVMRRARTYRGRIQIEDEEEYGRRHLVGVLSKSSWVKSNFLLARELARSLPHHGGTDLTRVIRRLAQEVSEAAPSFEQIRVKVHSDPGVDDVARVEEWIAGKGKKATDAARTTARKLVEELSTLYGPDRDWIGQGLKRLPDALPFRTWANRLRSLPKLNGLARLERLGGLMRGSRALIVNSSDGAANLAVLDLSLEIEQALLTTTLSQLRKAPPTRRRLVRMARTLLLGCYGSGMLSSRETRSLGLPLRPLLEGSQPDSGDYREAINQLGRASNWALGTVQYHFAEALTRYHALEPRTDRFVDDLVRGSPLLALGQVVRRLALDLDIQTGKVHRLLGKKFTGALALNPGVAVGRLRWVESGKAEDLRRTDIAVLPRTVSYLPPVAGILSLDEGNLLSHVQLLARNLGIPNASVTPDLAAQLKRLNGTRVMLAVDRHGSVLLEKEQRLPKKVKRLLTGDKAPEKRAKVDAPVPDLKTREPLPLKRLHADLSGKVVGPKAANLGELAKKFPGRVAAAIALPFGYFHAHTTRGGNSPRRRLDAAYKAHRLGKLSEAELNDSIASIRRQIRSKPMSLLRRRHLEIMFERQFGPNDSYGIFLRSDTNVEDLPGFTGAGLNKTIPHLTDLDSVLAAIPEVWASVLSSRSVAWRSGILKRPEQVYSSVLLMKSVGVEKSGVLVTRDLIGDRPGMTVTTAWGVGGAVDGEASETLVLRPDTTALLAAEAKTPYRRVLRDQGGVGWEPAPAGRVLTKPEMLALRKLGRQLKERLDPEIGEDGQPVPWDVEFGFLDGKLQLFQVRPLIERGRNQADEVVSELVGQSPTRTAWVSLDAVAQGTE